MNHRLARWLCLLCVCVLLTGCAADRGGSPAAGVTLPPVPAVRQAPRDDISQTYQQTVTLYLPSLDGSRLVAVPQQAVLSASRHSARALCEMLLAHPGTDSASPVGGGVALSLSETDAVEVSGQVATVSLAASALRLSHEQLFTVGQALANTLCQFGDVQYVNVLIAGAQPGLNIAATLPAGCFQSNTREDLTALWVRASAALTGARRSFAAALYYPAPSGKGVLCEGRTLSISAQDVPGMAQTLLEALSAGAEHLPGVPRCPDLAALLSQDISLEETGGNRRLLLRFREELNAALIDAGITRSIMIASLVYTMTTFLPGIEGVEVHIGAEKITSLTPSGTYSGAGESITFADGLLRRREFAPFLLAQCTLYFANARGGLTRINRPVPYYEACSVRALVQQLMLGPQPFDSQTGLMPVLPQGLRAADLLGVSFENRTVLLNFSDQLTALSQGMDGEAERRLVYALVNTLCELQGVKKAALFVQGAQPDTLAGAVFLPGDFLPNYNLIE